MPVQDSLSQQQLDVRNYRVLELSDVDSAAEVISQAFINDPLCAYMLPREHSRLNTLRKFFRAYANVSIQNQRGYGVGDPLVGIAFWLAPQQEDVSINISALKLFLPLLFTAYPLGYLRARMIIKQTELMRRKYAAQPHYYLDNLGVLPSEQGKGWAGRLLRPILEQADIDGVMAYTDTVTPRNVPLYEHFGFQVMEKYTAEDKGITIWSLRRPARLAAGG